ANKRAQAALDAVPRPALSVLLDHFDHIAKVAGVDHVGIGSDFDGIEVTPQQMEDVTMLPRIAQGLLDRGYSEADVKKILGGNMLRVMKIVLKPAKEGEPVSDARSGGASGTRRRFASRAVPARSCSVRRLAFVRRGEVEADAALQEVRRPAAQHEVRRRR